MSARAGSDLLDASDLLDQAHHLAEAIFMASQALGKEQGEPIRIVIELQQEKIEAAKVMIQGVTQVA